jgi:hypothetical protein
MKTRPLQEKEDLFLIRSGVTAGFYSFMGCVDLRKSCLKNTDPDYENRIQDCNKIFLDCMYE